MERLTIDTKILFCEIAQCREMPASTVCKDGYCDQRRVYERLREYERLGDIDDLTALVKARDEGRVVVLPCKAGDTVYFVGCDFSKCSTYGEKYDEASCEGCEITCDSEKTYSVYTKRAEDIWWILQRYFEFGKTYFTREAEAEAALKGESDGNS